MLPGPQFFLAVLFLLHPVFGIIGIVAVIILICCGVVTDLMTRNLVKDANQANIEAISKIGATLRHAEAIEAMGMLPALARRWRGLQMNALDLLDLGGSRSSCHDIHHTHITVHDPGGNARRRHIAGHGARNFAWRDDRHEYHCRTASHAL